MNKLLQKIAIGVSTLAVAASSVAMPAAAATYSATPFEFVGAAGDCGPAYPAGTGPVNAEWDYSTGNPAPSLLLQKLAPTTDCSSAGATINGVNGITLTELDFDLKTGEYCGAGAPRYNVVTSDNVTHFFGCASGTQTPIGTTGWTHVVFDPSNPVQAFPVIAPGTTVKSIELIQDETGTTHLDNLSINNQVIGGPTAEQSKESCKKGGYQNYDGTGGVGPFKNQGQCVSYFNH